MITEITVTTGTIEIATGIVTEIIVITEMNVITELSVTTENKRRWRITDLQV